MCKAARVEMDVTCDSSASARPSSSTRASSGTAADAAAADDDDDDDDDAFSCAILACSVMRRSSAVDGSTILMGDASGDCLQ